MIEQGLLLMSKIRDNDRLYGVGKTGGILVSILKWPVFIMWF